MQLFERLILGEAVPPQQQQQEEPPDYTQREPSPEEQQQAAEEVPPEEAQAQQQQAEEEQQQQEMQGQQPPMEEDPNAQPMGQPSDAEELDQYEGEIFKDIKPEQMAIKIEELKQQYKKFNSVIVAAMEKLDDVSHTTYDDALLEFIARKLLELKELSRDYLLKTFNTRTYIQNQIELQRMIVAFNLVTNLISEIRQSRIKRKTAIEERNNKLFKIKDKTEKFPNQYPRGFEEA
jgi:hypothetical protein